MMDKTRRNSDNHESGTPPESGNGKRRPAYPGMRRIAGGRPPRPGQPPSAEQDRRAAPYDDRVPTRPDDRRPPAYDRPRLARREDRERPFRRDGESAGQGGDRPYRPRPFRRDGDSAGQSGDRPYRPRPFRRDGESAGQGGDRPYRPRTFRRDGESAGQSGDRPYRPRPFRRTDEERVQQPSFEPDRPSVQDIEIDDADASIEQRAEHPAVADTAPMSDALLHAEDRLEGRNPIQEAIRAGRTINKVWVARRESKPDPALQRLVAQARDSGATIIETDRRVLDHMTGTHNHQGIVAQVAIHAYTDLKELYAQLLEQGKTPFLIILAEVQDSYNLGAVLRIADAAGAHAVIIPRHRSAYLDAAVAKASAGAMEHVPVCRVTNLIQTVLWLQDQGVWVTAAAAQVSQSYRTADWLGPIALVIGGEDGGVGQALLGHCDFQVAIPMHGQVNSLNTAVAAGIIVFEAVARRQEHIPLQTGAIVTSAVSESEKALDSAPERISPEVRTESVPDEKAAAAAPAPADFEARTEPASPPQE